MDSIIFFIQSNAAIAPYIIFALLLLAGFNIPVSEDLMLFISALLAIKNPELTYHLFAGVFLGAYLSDLICFWVFGKFLGPKLFEIKFLAKMIDKEKIDKVGTFYEKYGVITLLIGRFIPFGVRNALFITAGLGNMNPIKFAIADFAACLVSCIAFFSLYYTFGEAVIEYVKKGNIVLFSIAIIVALGFYISNKKKVKQKEKV